MAQLRETDQLERRAKDIVERLHGVWRRGRGMCCCPAHEDRIPSLSVTLGRTAILFHCFAGCSSEAVMEALEQQGVRPTQLFDGATERPPMPADRTDHARTAFRLWLSATSIVGSAAEGYLTNRGIAARSSQLRYLHRTPLGAGNAVRFVPAMVAAVRTDALIVAVHRTFLGPESPHLARFECPKRALGSLGQGADLAIIRVLSIWPLDPSTFDLAMPARCFKRADRYSDRRGSLRGWKVLSQSCQV